MKIFIPSERKQEFLKLSSEYSILFEELEQEPNSERRKEIIERISFISKQFENGLMDVTGFEL